MPQRRRRIRILKTKRMQKQKITRSKESVIRCRSFSPPSPLSQPPPPQLILRLGSSHHLHQPLIGPRQIPSPISPHRHAQRTPDLNIIIISSVWGPRRRRRRYRPEPHPRLAIIHRRVQELRWSPHSSSAEVVRAEEPVVPGVPPVAGA